MKAALVIVLVILSGVLMLVAAGMGLNPFVGLIIPVCWLLRISVLKPGKKQRLRNVLAT